MAAKRVGGGGTWGEHGSGKDVAAVYYTWIITFSKKQRSIKRVIRRDYCSVFISGEAGRVLAAEVGGARILWLNRNCKYEFYWM